MPHQWILMELYSLGRKKKKFKFEDYSSHNKLMWSFIFDNEIDHIALFILTIWKFRDNFQKQA